MPYDPSPYLTPEHCGLILFECQEGVIGDRRFVLPRGRLRGRGFRGGARAGGSRP